MQNACDSCKKVDHLFPCSGCGWARYCSPRCQTNHLPFHEKDCKMEVELVKAGELSAKQVASMYKQFVVDEKVYLFMAGFSYYCFQKNGEGVPECTVSVEDAGAYLAIMKERSSPEISDSITESPGYIRMSLGFQKRECVYTYDAILFPLSVAQTMYSLYKSLFDIASDIRFQVYNSTNIPKGMKGTILVIYNNIKEEQKLAFI